MLAICKLLKVLMEKVIAKCSSSTKKVTHFYYHYESRSRRIKTVNPFYRSLAITPIFFIFLNCNAINKSEPSTINYLSNKNAIVKTLKDDNGNWQLLVNNKPYFIRGVTYSPAKIGEDPASNSLTDWMNYDQNGDGINDVAFQTWHDKNKNNIHDTDEISEGDFSLLQKMGCNTIRIYHPASNNPILGNLYKLNDSEKKQFDHAVNKDVLRKMYSNFGIMAMMGNFMGAWTIGSGADYTSGTDYTNKTQRENIKKSVQAMVLDNMNEPYVLMWVLGNENTVIGFDTHCNAVTEHKAYSELIQEIAQWIHKTDPNHPVAVCDKDNNLETFLTNYANLSSEIDIISFNSYPGKNGFGNLFQEVKTYFDRPVFLSEWGMFAYQNGSIDEDLQLEYIRGCYQNIVDNSSGGNGIGNCIGGTVYDWCDRWWFETYDSANASRHDSGKNPFWLPTDDGRFHEEWFGLTSMGDGTDYLMRQTRKAYDYFKSVWNNN